MAWYMLMRIFFSGDAIIVTHATTDIIVYVSFQAFTQVGGSWWDTGVLVGFLVPTLYALEEVCHPGKGYASEAYYMSRG